MHFMAGLCLILVSKKAEMGADRSGSVQNVGYRERSGRTPP